MEPYWQDTEDYHTAGEPFRIVRNLPQQYPGQGLPVSDLRLLVLNTADHPLDFLRRLLCHEPRGHADMYRCFVLPPNDSSAHFGILFWHRDGFSTACGHGTIALGHWAMSHSDLLSIDKPADGNGKVDVVIDVPSGRVIARTFLQYGVVQKVEFVSVPSCQVSSGQVMSVKTHVGEKTLTVDLAYGGATYACVDVKDLGYGVEPKYYQRFITLQKKIKAELGDRKGKDEIYGVCFYEDVSENEKSITQKNVVVFADGQIDRSPCGSGTAARAAVLLAQGRLTSEKTFIHQSILGTTFAARVEPYTGFPEGIGSGEFPACVPVISGKAQLVGQMRFLIDPSDEVNPGFLFR